MECIASIKHPEWQEWDDKALTGSEVVLVDGLEKRARYVRFSDGLIMREGLGDLEYRKTVIISVDIEEN